jgi:hypothetical protein
MVTYLNEFEVAKIIGLAVQTLRNWRFIGKGIPYTKAGRSVRYELGDVLEFMKARRVEFEEK